MSSFYPLRWRSACADSMFAIFIFLLVCHLSTPQVEICLRCCRVWMDKEQEVPDPAALQLGERILKVSELGWGRAMDG